MKEFVSHTSEDDNENDDNDGRTHVQNRADAAGRKDGGRMMAHKKIHGRSWTEYRISIAAKMNAMHEASSIPED